MLWLLILLIIFWLWWMENEAEKKELMRKNLKKERK